MQGFELIDAVASRVAVPLDGRREQDEMRRTVHLNASSTTQEGNRVTAIIGRNGTGKSHVLASLVESMIRLGNLGEARRKVRGGLPLDSFSWRVGDNHVAVSGVDGTTHIEVNGRPAPPGAPPLPGRLVALTITPFDKFPVTRTNSRNGSDDFYRYLGLRDRTGRASMENLLFRSLAGLFETSDVEALKRARISRAFEFLGLHPKLTVVYRIRVAREVLRAVLAGESIVNPDVIRDKARLRRVQEAIDREELDEGRLASALLRAQEIVENERIRLDASFQAGARASSDFEALLPLRMVGFAQLSAVEVQHIDGPVTDLKRASSGQLSMVTAILALAAVMRDDSLVLIDEPELSLHPEWQVRYISLLLETFSSYRGCHFVIATHSPLVVAELPPNSTLVALDDPEVPGAPDLAGQSSDVLLAEAFGMPERNNLHVRDLLVAALRAAADGKAPTPAFKRQVDHLEKVTARLPAVDGIRVVVRELEQTAETSSTEAAVGAD